LNVNGWFGSFLGHGETHGFFEGFFGVFSHPLTWVSLIMAGTGVLLAYAIYNARWLSAGRIRKLFSPVHSLLSRKYLFDELYERIIARKILYEGLFAGLKVVDSQGIDGLVNGAAVSINNAGRFVRKVQSGQLQLYGIFIILGITLIILAMFLFG
jgi:NADH-quinone oxidoreductase subunit L